MQITVARRKIELREVGSFKESYPDWVKNLKRKRGIYLISLKSEPTKIRYIGCSLKNLYHTLTRHFQYWGKDNPWWGNIYRHQYYTRNEVLAGFVLTRKGQTGELEDTLIRLLDPVDNWYRPEPIPF